MTDPTTFKPLRILAIHRYFWPDAPPYATMLRTIASRWVADGHQVDVISSQPSYKPNAGITRQPEMEILDGIHVRRLDLPPEHGRPLTRLLNIIRFSLAIMRHTSMSGPYDVIMASTAPPVILAAAACLAARRTGARFIYHCMDIHPEIGCISGEFRHPLVFSLLRRMDALTCKSADSVIVLSADMAQSIRQRPGGSDTNIRIINNFMLPSFSLNDNPTIPHEFRKPDGGFRILFAGNIGRFQGLESVVDAMHKLNARSDLELVFLGEGKVVETLKHRAGSLLNNRIKFFPHQPVDIARIIIQSADLCLVTLIPGIFRFAFPSKTMTYIGEGRPLIVSVEPNSELTNFVRSEKIGIAIDPNNSDALASAIIDLIDDPTHLQKMSQRAMQVGRKYFGQTVILNHWSALMKQMASQT
jgi:glycosyltransferase involved in cell wall biosynthesis